MFLSFASRITYMSRTDGDGDAAGPRGSPEARVRGPARVVPLPRELQGQRPGI